MVTGRNWTVIRLMSGKIEEDFKISAGTAPAEINLESGKER